MPDMTLRDLAEAIRGIDFGMLSTKAEGGGVASRPMSNNREVEYDGASFFSHDGARTISDIERDAQVGLSFTGSTLADAAGKPPLFVAIQGRAELIRDKAAFERHRVPDLERWFARGVDTPGLVLVEVRAERIHCGDGGDEGELRL